MSDERNLVSLEELLSAPRASIHCMIMRGTLMIGYGINSGDVIFYDESGFPRDGDIVIIRYCKQSYAIRRLKGLRLVSHNGERKIRERITDSVEIIGPMVGQLIAGRRPRGGK